MASSITVIGIGKVRNSATDEVLNYQKMLRPYIRLNTVFIKPPSSGSVDSLLEAEKKLIERKLPAQHTLIAMGEEGRQLSSRRFADLIENLTSAPQEPVFVIGGAYGLSPAIKEASREVLSLSPMTFPHRLCWILLAEQIYRAFTILKGHPYHKQ